MCLDNNDLFFFHFFFWIFRSRSRSHGNPLRGSSLAIKSLNPKLVKIGKEEIEGETLTDEEFNFHTDGEEDPLSHPSDHTLFSPTTILKCNYSTVLLDWDKDYVNKWIKNVRLEEVGIATASLRIHGGFTKNS